MAELGTPTKTLVVRIELPAELELPIHIDDEGRSWPMDGLMHQKHIGFRELEAIGVKVTWRDPNGLIIPRERIEAWLKNRLEDQQAGYVPTFANTQKPGG